jgi:hypothetical protein
MQREAKYKLGNCYYCDDKAIVTLENFREISKTCQEGFELIKDF